MHRYPLLIAACIVGLSVFAGQAGAAPRKAVHDEPAPPADADAQMNTAFVRAQRGFGVFLAALDGRTRGASAFSVKIRIEDGGASEYFWITGLSRKGARFSGTLDNQPETLRNVSFGQTVTFTRSDVRDWGFVLDGKLQGNFTTCVLLSREDPAQARRLQQQIGLTCD